MAEAAGGEEALAGHQPLSGVCSPKGSLLVARGAEAQSQLPESTVREHLTLVASQGRGCQPPPHQLTAKGEVIKV